jgi:ribose transport system permease protein
LNGVPATSSAGVAGNERTAARSWEVRLSFLGPYIGLALVLAFFSYFTWQRGALHLFLSLDNFKLIAVHAAIPATVALGMTMIMISGGIDLSVGYVVSLVTVVTMLTYRWAANEPSWAAFPGLVAVTIGVGTGALFGWSNGMLITRLKVVPFVVTLGMMGVARGIAQYLSGGEALTFTDPRHPEQVLSEPQWVSWLGAIQPEPRWLGIGPSALGVCVLAVGVAVLLHFTVLGRYCYALGSNEATARLCGVNVERTKVVLYTIAGILTGWGGVLQFARSGAGLHDVAAGMELEVIAAVVIGGGSLLGGEGTVIGTLVGAILIALLANGCSKLKLPMEFRFIVIGLIIIVVSALNSWRQRRLR